MNQEIFESNWPIMRHRVKDWWDILTDDELDQTEGKSEQLVALLQRRYGTRKEYTQKEFERRVNQADLI